jgi:NAD(P)-dependent dehydrogenase (short-subunit alcohol dehydrogenase family)
MDDGDWDFVLDIDVKGTFYCVQAVAEHMIGQRYGKVLNISSAAGTGIGIHSDDGERLPQADNANYQAAKAAVIQLTKTFARELGPHGINVNCIAPGTLMAQMATTIRTPREVEEHVRAKVKWAVLNRAGTPADVANAALFLVSDESSFISGQLLCVDGGRTDRM